MTEVSWAMIEAACATRSWLLSYDDKSRALVAGIYLAMEAARIPAPAPDDECGWRWHLDDAGGARANLRNHQAQADMHGERVTVSRQALDEVLDAIDAALTDHTTKGEE